MKTSLRSYFICGLTLLFFSLGCNTARETTLAVDKVSDQELTKVLFEKDSVPFDFFYSKIGVELTTGKKNSSFNTSLKMRVDSAFSGTIKMVIIFGTFLVDQDSIKFVNKIDKCYNLEDLSLMSTMLGTTIEYDFFQSLLLGLPIGLDQNSDYVQLKSKEGYILSSHTKRDFKNLENDRMDVAEYDDIYIQYHMAPETFDLSRINIKIPSDTVEINIDYAERKLIDETYWVPEQTNITIYHPRDTVTIELDYGTVKINEPKSIKIKIPESYEECPE